MAEARNLLAEETSPYLLQHADNPVHWRAWGPAALAEAAAADKPILLSIGYAACHWCHVMAHESFEDPDTAALMNRLFVNIKVDREERPDIDHLYMTALQAMGEQGGWPLTMALTPSGRPFWGGTYFPPESRFGRPGFRTVLVGLADAWNTERDRIALVSSSLSKALAAQGAARPGAAPGPDLLETARTRFVRSVDTERGGLRGAPKFPNTPLFRFLWQDAHRAGDAAAAHAVRHLLEAMSQGGIYDHLGGGYARYSTDDEWLVPHFEKMLYDNALILELLAFAHAARPDPLFAARAAETVGWLTRDMLAPGGAAGADNAAFAASEDADSEGEEGKFYVWTRAEIKEVLGPDFDFFEGDYDLPAGGNWEGRIILRRTSRIGEAADEHRLAAAREKLRAARARRIRPGRDDKILADWNGLAIAALVRAACVFSRPDWLTLASRAATAIATTHRGADGRYAHAWRLGRVTAAGLIDDQGAMLRATLALFEATGEAAWLSESRAIAEAAERHFADGEGAFFTAAADATDLPDDPAFRARNAADGPTPAGLGLMAEAFARLHHLTGETVWRSKADALLAAFGGLGGRLIACSTLLAAADLLENATTLVIVGDPAAPAFHALHQAALAASDPATIVLPAASTAGLADTHPAHGKIAAGPAAAFICRAGTCGLPVTEARGIRQAMREPA